MNHDYTYLTNEYFFYIVMINIFSFITLIFFLLIKDRIKPFPQKKHLDYTLEIHTSWYLIFFIIIFMLIGYLTIHVYGSISYDKIITDNARFYGLSKRGTAWIFYLIEIIILTLLYDLYSNEMTKTKVFFLFAILALLATTGGRSIIMIYIFFIFFLYTVVHRYKINFLLLLFVIIFTMVVFIGSSLMRHKIDLQTYIATKTSKFDSNQAFMLNDTIELIENSNENTILIDIIAIPYSLVPRAIWKEKPLSTAATRLVYPEIADRGTNITFGLYANALLNLHYLAFWFIPFFLFIYNYLYFKVLNSHSKTILNFTLLYLSIKSVQFIRGGIIDLRILLILVMILLSYILFHIISKKKKYII